MLDIILVNVMKLQLKIAAMASRMAFLISAVFLKQHGAGSVHECANYCNIIGEPNHGSTRVFLIYINVQIVFLPYVYNIGMSRAHSVKNLIRSLIQRIQLQAQGTELVKGFLGAIHNGLHLFHMPDGSLFIRSHEDKLGYIPLQQ